MQPYQRQFIEFALAHGALQLGTFTLKSGRISPYFFNSGVFHTGKTLEKLGEFYADAITNSTLTFDTLFGPAYKGIPLATATAIALATKHNRDVPWCFNRKEIKEHGEGGQLVGAPLSGGILMIDDVITAGTAFHETYRLVEAQGATLVGVVIAMDRQERLSNTDATAPTSPAQSATQKITTDYSIPVLSIINCDDLLAYLEQSTQHATHCQAIRAYRACYGV